MQTTKLMGKCLLYYYDSTKYNAENPSQLDNEWVSCVDAKFPSNVELCLSEAGVMPKDLFFANNIKLTEDYELYDWWYKIEFDVTKKQLDSQLSLKFLGVDTIANYYLNGKLLGKSANMYIEHEFDINALAVVGKNALFVNLKSAIKYASEQDYPPYINALPVNSESVRLRKAPHSFGWDIMPRALSAGIWRDVLLVERNKVEIEDIYLYTTHLNEDSSSALVWFNWNLKMPCAKYNKIKLNFSAKCQDSVVEFSTNVRFKYGTCRITFDKNLKLWNPFGYGDPNLYEVEISLTDGERVLAVKNCKFGVRLAEIEYSETGGDDGFFTIKINHQQIMVKGTNWVPADAFHSRDKERIPRMIDEIVDMNCNMIRCWGGNVYEDHLFYDLCDKKGLLVWQDFAMACSQYPYDEDFCKELADEVQKVAVALRNHCSLLLYCGDNECDIMTYYNRIDPNTNKLTRKIIPEALNSYDPFRAYIPSSPYISPTSYKLNNDSKLPEAHLWGPRDNFKSSFYMQDDSNFISEIGYHGCPSVSSIKKFIDEDHVWPQFDNDQWTVHCTAPDKDIKNSIYAYRVELMTNQIRELFGDVPTDMQEFVIASQISQAEAKKFFIEFTRQKKWKRSGIIWWNALDGWPQFSDAVIDYYFNRKLAVHYIRRSQEPVQLIMCEPFNWSCKLIVSNDSNMTYKGKYYVVDADDDSVVSQGEFSCEANQNKHLSNIPVSNGVQKMFLLKIELENGKVIANHYLHGHSPFSFDKYKKYLEKIAQLDGSFDYTKIGG